MARIRCIKPEFPQSESIGRLSRDARLLFIQLWTLVDDEGRTRGSSRMLASLLYPYDDDAPNLISAWLVELEQQGMIRVYDVECCRFLEVSNWLKHQKIDKPSKSRLPTFDEGSTNPREPSRTLAPDLGPGSRTLDLDQEATGSSEPVAPSKLKYPPAFEGWWLAYPRTPIMSKKEALAAWSKLSPEDRLQAVTAIAPYRKFLTENPTHPPVHACRFLSQRRFEGFQATAGPAASYQPPPGAVSFIEKMKEKSNGHADGTEIRGDPGLGEKRPDLAAELFVSGRSALRSAG